MITSNDEMIDLKIDEPISSKHNHYHQQESSGYSSKEAECSSPENRTPSQQRHYENKLRFTTHNHPTNHSNKTAEIHRRRHRYSISSNATTSVLPSDTLTIDESSNETNGNDERMVRSKTQLGKRTR